MCIRYVCVCLSVHMNMHVQVKVVSRSINTVYTSAVLFNLTQLDGCAPAFVDHCGCRALS